MPHHTADRWSGQLSSLSVSFIISYRVTTRILFHLVLCISKRHLLFFYTGCSEMITFPSRLIEDITSHLIHTVDRESSLTVRTKVQKDVWTAPGFQVLFSVTLCSLILQGPLVPFSEVLSLSAPGPFSFSARIWQNSPSYSELITLWSLGPAVRQQLIKAVGLHLCNSFTLPQNCSVGRFETPPAQWQLWEERTVTVIEVAGLEAVGSGKHVRDKTTFLESPRRVCQRIASKAMLAAFLVRWG